MPGVPVKLYVVVAVLNSTIPPFNMLYPVAPTTVLQFIVTVVPVALAVNIPIKSSGVTGVDGADTDVMVYGMVAVSVVTDP